MLNSDVEFSPGHFDILYFFSDIVCRNHGHLNFALRFVSKIHQNSCFIFSPASIPLHVSTVQRIYFFEVFIFFCDFLNTKKAIHGGGLRGRKIKFLWRMGPRAPQKGHISVAHEASVRHRIFTSNHWRGPHVNSVAHEDPCATELPLFVAHGSFMHHRNVGILWRTGPRVPQK